MDGRAGRGDPRDRARVRDRAARGDLLHARDHRARVRRRQHLVAREPRPDDRPPRLRVDRAERAARPEQRPGPERLRREPAPTSPATSRSTTRRCGAKFSEAWGAEVPERAGYRLDQMMSGLHDGRIKALYLIGENPAQTEPNAHHVEEGLSQLEFLVSQDLFLNETAREARGRRPPRVELRGEGRHVHEHRAAGEPRARRGAAAGERARRPARSCSTLARALGCDWPDYPDAESVWNELADLCPNWYGIRYHRLEEEGLQWPCPSLDDPGSTLPARGARRRGRPGRASSIRSSTSRRSRSPTPSTRSCSRPAGRSTTTTRAR